VAAGEGGVTPLAVLQRGETDLICCKTWGLEALRAPIPAWKLGKEDFLEEVTINGAL
jgi:hypothetical protein